MNTPKAQFIISIATSFLLILAVTICKGNKFQNSTKQNESTTEQLSEASGIVRQADDGTYIISTKLITQEVKGYGGVVPLEIYMKDNRIVNVVALNNSESPSYFAKVRNSTLLKQWNNLLPDEAISKKVDGVSGATDSSDAIIQTVHKAMEYVKQHSIKEPEPTSSFDWALFFELIIAIALLPIVLSYFSKQHKQQVQQYTLNSINLVLVIVVTALSIYPKNSKATIKEEPIMTQSNNPSALDVIHSRTSIRSYLPQEVEKEKIEQLLRAAMAAPTAVNKQPWAFVAITDREVLDTLASAMPYAKMLTEAPLAVVVCGDMSKALEGDGRDYWIQDVSAATQNLLLAAQGLGLGAVWTGVYPVKERVEKVSKVIGLPKHIIPLSLVPIGYANENPLPKDKWKPENVHYNGWTEGKESK